ncbi:hypothetical protein LTR37_002021 [Vermiconidia calcicola]|uniref:Uncharacterized protein n=1 Tax=Vermiconidia calcicola TaxID=1690605 RepID=A0ACC3NVV2_9PEZI|nr:hypothetical protein LTR37_002021 [Vermiconidia calcicola]
MAHYKADESAFSKVKDTVVVISGGATGIGAATVQILAQNGAKVVLGDINADAAEQLCKTYSGLSFVKCDVANYDDIYNLFKTAYDQHGRVDHAISSAGTFETGNFFDPELTLDTVKQHGNMKTLDVNLVGTLNFARVAAVFLREGRQKGEDKSIMLLSSVNALRENPGLFIYQTGKHGVQGLLRSSRKTLYERDGTRLNAVCPGVTESEMTEAFDDSNDSYPAMSQHVIPKFKENDLFYQPADVVAKTIVGVQADPSAVGKAYYIEGGDSWEIEDSIWASQPQWLGEEATRRLRVNHQAMLKGVLLS